MLIGSIGAAPFSVIFELLWIKDTRQSTSVAGKGRAACGASADQKERGSSRIMRLSTVRQSQGDGSTPIRRRQGGGAGCGLCVPDRTRFRSVISPHYKTARSYSGDRDHRV